MHAIALGVLRSPSERTIRSKASGEDTVIRSVWILPLDDSDPMQVNVWDVATWIDVTDMRGQDVRLTLDLTPKGFDHRVSIVGVESADLAGPV